MSFAPQDNYSVHFPSQYHIAIRHPGQVRLRRTRAGIQLDSPSTSLDEIPPPASPDGEADGGQASIPLYERGKILK